MINETSLTGQLSNSARRSDRGVRNEEIYAALVRTRNAFNQDPKNAYSLIPAAASLASLRRTAPVPDAFGSWEVARADERGVEYSAPDLSCDDLEELIHAANLAFEGFSKRVILTRRPCLSEPEYHADDAAATIILPLTNAETPFSKRILRPVWAIERPEYKAAITGIRVAYVDEKTISRAPYNQMFIMKGRSWGPGHIPLVHSAPVARDQSSSAAIACAYVVEITSCEAARTTR